MALSVPRLLPTKTYPFSDIRHTLAATGIQAGVMATGAATEFKVTQDTGANMNVKIAAGDSGAWVTGLDTTRQGAYHVYNDAIITTAVSAANATNPRIDQVVLRVYDSTVIGGGTDAAAIEVIAGTATAGATLANRTGAANLATIAAPKSLIRLADILVPAASTAVTNANIVDRRPWALGAFRRIVRNANAAAGNDYALSATGPIVEIDATNLKPRIECTGVPLRVTVQARGSQASATGSLQMAVLVDGTAPDGGPGWGWTSTTGQELTVSFSQVVIPAAGSHLVSLGYTLSAGVFTALARSTNPLLFTVEELVHQNADNT